MSASAASDLTIDSLALSCHARDKQQALNALDSADWPLTDHRQIVMVRRIEIDSDALSLGRHAAAQVRSLIAGAVSPWEAGADQAEAVRFADTADYLCSQCRQILSPPAQVPWFWASNQRIQDSLAGRAKQADSLLGVLLEEPLALPSLITRLQTRALLTPALSVLGGRGMTRLRELIAHYTGYALPDTKQPAISAAADTAAQNPLPAALIRLVRQRQAQLQQLPENLHQAAGELFALLIAWQHSPASLSQPDTAAELLMQLQQALLSSPGKSLAQAHKSQPSPQTQAIDSKLSATPLSKPESTQPTGSSSARSDEASATDAIRLDQTEPVEGEQDSDPAIAPSESFYTAQGGFFMLLNLLRAVRSHEGLRDCEASAWQYLYLLTRRLQLPLDIPLQQFIAAQLQLEHYQELELLPHDACDELLAKLAEQRLGHQPFWPDTLLQRAALVHVSDSHIDVDMHKDSIDLNIRLCGLDVDPGWLPWLGRVVRFHYLESPQLRPDKPPEHEA